MLFALLAVAAAAAAPDYRDEAAWLCRPGRIDPCTPDPVRSVAVPGGSLRPEPVTADAGARADCFYVYPTASNDAGDNSDMVPGLEERGQAMSQAAAFAPVCRVFAPAYRQVTLTALHAGRIATADWGMAYGDVRAAFADYLAHDNGGRPFVLIGHSQGSLLLKRLVKEEIDGKPVAGRMLSAILPGTAVLVPAGKDVGGDFRGVPLCRAAGQTGCVVTWASYRDGAPPPANALFGRSADPALVAGCTNPAALVGAAPGGAGGGAAPLDVTRGGAAPLDVTRGGAAPLDVTRSGAAPLDAIIGFPWWRGGFVQYRAPADWPAPTRFVRVPGALTGRCVERGGIRYLAVDATHATGIAAAVLDPATVGDAAYPEWGLHVMDVPLVQADLVRLVAAETAAWRARSAP